MNFIFLQRHEFTTSTFPTTKMGIKTKRILRKNEANSSQIFIFLIFYFVLSDFVLSDLSFKIEATKTAFRGRFPAFRGRQKEASENDDDDDDDDHDDDAVPGEIDPLLKRHNVSGKKAIMRGEKKKTAYETYEAFDNNDRDNDLDLKGGCALDSVEFERGIGGQPCRIEIEDIEDIEEDDIERVEEEEEEGDVVEEVEEKVSNVTWISDKKSKKPKRKESDSKKSNRSLYKKESKKESKPESKKKKRLVKLKHLMLILVFILLSSLMVIMTIVFKSRLSFTGFKSRFLAIGVRNKSSESVLHQSVNKIVNQIYQSANASVREQSVTRMEEFGVKDGRALFSHPTPIPDHEMGMPPLRSRVPPNLTPNSGTSNPTSNPTPIPRLVPEPPVERPSLLNRVLRAKCLNQNIGVNEATQGSQGTQGTQGSHGSHGSHRNQRSRLGQPSGLINLPACIAYVYGLRFGPELMPNRTHFSIYEESNLEKQNQNSRWSQMLNLDLEQGRELKTLFQELNAKSGINITKVKDKLNRQWKEGKLENYTPENLEKGWREVERSREQTQREQTQNAPENENDKMAPVGLVIHMSECGYRRWTTHQGAGFGSGVEFPETHQGAGGCNLAGWDGDNVDWERIFVSGLAKNPNNSHANSSHGTFFKKKKRIYFRCF